MRLLFLLSNEFFFWVQVRIFEIFPPIISSLGIFSSINFILIIFGIKDFFMILRLISITVQKTANRLRAKFFLRLLVSKLLSHQTSNYVRPLKQVRKDTSFQALVSKIQLAFSHPINRVHVPISVERSLYVLGLKESLAQWLSDILKLW